MKRFSIALSLVLNSLSLVAATSASANPAFHLTNDINGISLIEGTVSDVRSLCPEGFTCFTNGTVISLALPLLGCADQLGPVSYAATETADGRLLVQVSAVNLHSHKSQLMLCYAAPVATAEITLVGQYGHVEVSFLSALATTADAQTSQSAAASN